MAGFEQLVVPTLSFQPLIKIRSRLSVPKININYEKHFAFPTGFIAPMEIQSQQGHSLFQFSTPHLSQGMGAGFVNIMQLARKGNFGLGTFEQTEDGLTALYNEYYQTKANGKVPDSAFQIRTRYSKSRYVIVEMAP